MNENENNITPTEQTQSETELEQTSGINLQPRKPIGPMVNEPVINPAPVPEKKKKSGGKILLIILILLIIGGGIFLGVKYIFPKDEPETVEDNKILYTFTDPLNTKINIIKKDMIDESYKGVDLTRYEDKEDEVRKKVRSYVMKDSEVKALDLTKDYKDVYDKYLRHIRGINGGGYSLEKSIDILKEDFPYTSDIIIEYVVNNSRIDWNDQALLLVYKNLGNGHSKEYIKNKLVKEEFTEEEIEIAMAEIEDVDFYEQALEEACFYRFYKKYEKSKTISLLQKDKYTEEEITYAVKTAYEDIK